MCRKEGVRCPSDEYGGPHNSPAKWRERQAKRRAKVKLLNAIASGDAAAITAAQEHYNSFVRPRHAVCVEADQPETPASSG